MKKHSWIRLLAFFILPVLCVYVINRTFIQTDSVTALTMHEMKNRSDIQTALVGSSVVRNQFDAQRITEITGRETFNVSSPCLTLPGSIAITDQLFDTNHPEWVVLFLEHDTFSSDVENTEALLRLMPFLKNPLRRLRYYLDTSAQDDQYFERLFYFRLAKPGSLTDIRNTLALHTNPAKYLEQHPGLDEHGTSYYHGRGFMDVTEPADIDTYLRETRYTGDAYTSPFYPSEYAKAKLLEYRDLCEKHGSKLIVFFSPLMTARSLAESSYLSLRSHVTEFLTENGVLCYDLSLALPEYMPNLDEYYLDFYHVNSEGAQVLSENFAQILNTLENGEDISRFFYASYSEMLDAVDCVTNVYAETIRENNKRTYRAHSNHGPKQKIEYAFAVISENGEETLLRDYSSEDTFSCEPERIKGKHMRVYARPAGKKEAHDPKHHEEKERTYHRHKEDVVYFDLDDEMI